LSSKTSTSRQNRQRSSVVFCVFGTVEVILHFLSSALFRHSAIGTFVERKTGQ
jgi:hypothetical protein